MPDDFPGAGEIGANGHYSAAKSALPLARRLDFRLGVATVRPSVRTVEGPGGSVEAEPRVMQVLLAFADAEGAVLTRDDLLQSCWNGQIVGDDALNRAIFELRRIARETDGGFGIETIPRIGYRMTGGLALNRDLDANAVIVDPVPGSVPNTTRRWVLGGTLVAGVGALGLWSALRDRMDPRVVDLVERGTEALRDDLPESAARGADFFSRAVAIAPDDAATWGLLAVARQRAAEGGPPGASAAKAQTSEMAARRALALDSKEPNALTTLVRLRFSLDDWRDTEDQLRKILEIAPNNIATLGDMAFFLQGVGRTRDSWTCNERAVAIDPLSPSVQFPKALKLWIFGRQREADQVIDRALELWPQHPWVWNARLLIFAFTNRPRAALSMIDGVSRPKAMSPAAISVWRASLTALETRSTGNIAAAREAILSVASEGPGLAAYGIMILSALNELDAAFAVAEGFLLQRGPLVGPTRTGDGGVLVNDPQWRRTQWLFTPATAPFRADPRFGTLADDIGLADYWRRRGVKPDYLLLRT